MIKALNRPELNGKEATVQKKLLNGQFIRYEVLMKESKKTERVKPENLIVKKYAILANVKITGLANDTYLNGKEATVVKVLSDGYNVVVKESKPKETVMVKPENLIEKKYERGTNVKITG